MNANPDPQHYFYAVVGIGVVSIPRIVDRGLPYLSYHRECSVLITVSLDRVTNCITEFFV